MNPVMVVCFSGGRTSAYMTKMLLDNYSDSFDFVVLFTNTGQEHNKTLDFVNKCDKEWGFNTVWLEALVDPEKGKGTRYKIVNYTNASRDGQPYYDVVSKYGLPSHAYLHCTRELKENPIKAYRKDNDLMKASFALGMRVDEPKRVKPLDKRGDIVYPLVDMFPTTKQEILSWFSKQSFDLGIPEYLGNCKWCFKKTLSKLIKVAKENPNYFDFPKKLEDDFKMIGSEKFDGEPRKLFRGYRDTTDIINLAKDNVSYNNDLFEIVLEDAGSNDCGESCEPFAK